MGMQMLAGRPFTSQDGPGAPQVVIINETFARRILPNENLIGQRISVSTPATIVGVVGDTRKNLDQEAPPQVYVPFSQRSNFGQQDRGGLLVMRAASSQNTLAGLSNLAATIRDLVRAIDPNVHINQVVAMDEHLSNSV